MNKYCALSLLLFLLLVSCHPEEEEWADAKITGVSVEPDVTTAHFTAKVNFQGDKEILLELGEQQNLSDAQGYKMTRMDDYHFVVDVDDLNRATTYYYQIQVKNSFLSLNTEIAKFKTFSEKPMVETGSVDGVTINSSTVHGTVTDGGGVAVTERGFCWGLIDNPTISNSHVACGSGLGVFSFQLTNLQACRRYFVRAYAINSQGTVYGESVSFMTLAPAAPEGAVEGTFSVSSSQSIWFSKGNLQYQASSNSWRFAENQWNFVGGQIVNSGNQPSGNVPGSDNHNISQTYDGWIDLFGWGTSGYSHGAVCYQPWSTDQQDKNYYAFGSESSSLSGRADWGYNRISNGGDQVNLWRTLSKDQWMYVIDTRQTASGIRYAKARVNGVNGLLLFPDQWDTLTYPLNSVNTGDAPFDSNIVTLEQWNMLESKGVVFLPITGHRQGGIGIDCLEGGEYWSSTNYVLSYYSPYDFYSYALNFYHTWVKPSDYAPRSNGCAVRLVRYVE